MFEPNKLLCLICRLELWLLIVYNKPVSRFKDVSIVVYVPMIL